MGINYENHPKWVKGAHSVMSKYCPTKATIITPAQMLVGGTKNNALGLSGISKHDQHAWDFSLCVLCIPGCSVIVPCKPRFVKFGV